MADDDRRGGPGEGPGPGPWAPPSTWGTPPGEAAGAGGAPSYGGPQQPYGQQPYGRPSSGHRGPPPPAWVHGYPQGARPQQGPYPQQGPSASGAEPPGQVPQSPYPAGPYPTGPYPPGSPPGWGTAPPRRAPVWPWVAGGVGCLLVLLLGIGLAVAIGLASWAGGFGGASSYGDDPELDALWDACAARDAAACDQLYSDSPFLSEYEEFGETCGFRVEPGDWCVDRVLPPD